MKMAWRLAKAACKYGNLSAGLGDNHWRNESGAGGVAKAVSMAAGGIRKQHRKSAS